MGGFSVNGRLKYEFNNDADVLAVREFIDPAEHVSAWSADFDLARNEVTAPGKDGITLAREIQRYANRYFINEGANRIDYSLLDENCSAWANSILKKAGVSAADRLKAGEFFGIDWGEEDEIPATAFD